MPSAAVEDYAKAIFTLARESASGEATVVRLAAVLGVTKGSVTSMVHKLRESGLARAERYGGVRLTPKGELLALDVIRRHRLIEVFLVNVLGLDWSQVHDEAERLEHAMSPRLLERLDAFLGHPTIDPHGDPIPDASGKLPMSSDRPLHALAEGEVAAILRVTDQQSEFLAFASSHGLCPGAQVRIVRSLPQAESIVVRSGTLAEVSLSYRVAERIRIPSQGQAHPAKRV